ncbi:MAG: SDR family oxidoreductase [Alkalilacustris sp.]
MRDSIAGRTVWITGAGSGIGAAMAHAFAAAGATVALTGRSEEPLRALAADIGAPALVYPGDVCDRPAMATIASDLVGRTGGLHVLCNNAGLNVPPRYWRDLGWDAQGPAWEDWRAVIDVNLTGALNVICAALGPMRAAGAGVMIHTASWAGRFNSPVAGVAYGAAKHAVVSLSASLNAEEGANGIRSTALCPAEVATPLLLRRPGFDPARAAAMIQPEDMAEAALFVARMNPNVAVPEITLSPVRRDTLLPPCVRPAQAGSQPASGHTPPKGETP